jgi:hypothetical protein
MSRARASLAAPRVGNARPSNLRPGAFRLGLLTRRLGRDLVACRDGGPRSSRGPSGNASRRRTRALGDYAVRSYSPARLSVGGAFSRRLPEGPGSDESWTPALHASRNDLRRLA